MGEAKRRKQSGTYYRDAGHVEDYRVPDGMIGITVEVPGVPPVTVDIGTEHLTEMMAAAATTCATKPYQQLVEMLAGYFAKQVRQGGDFAPIAIPMLWTAFNHPKHGKVIRDKASEALRHKGRAHITWQMAQQGFAVAVGDRYLDSSAMMAKAAAAGVSLVAIGDDPDKTPQH